MVGGGKPLWIEEFFVKTIFFITEAILYVMQDSNIWKFTVQAVEKSTSCYGTDK